MMTGLKVWAVECPLTSQPSYPDPWPMAGDHLDLVSVQGCWGGFRKPRAEPSR